MMQLKKLLLMNVKYGALVIKVIILLTPYEANCSKSLLILLELLYNKEQSKHRTRLC